MPTDPVSLTPQAVYETLRARRAWVVGPAIAGFVVAALMSVVTPRDWKAEQGLIIRSEAAGFVEQRLGKFTDLSEMKTVQETLLEVARSQSVIEAVLRQVGPATCHAKPDWPSPRDVVDFRDNLRITPPGGAEFGKTEVFYIGLLDTDADRAVRLVEALTDQLETRLQQLRDVQASSLVAELERSVGSAQATLDTEVARLTDFERSVGADLAALRQIESPGGGQSDIGQQALAIDAEIMRAAAERRRFEKLVQLLGAISQNPGAITSLPDTLLAGQPALVQLKTGVAQAQLNFANLQGKRTATHPFVVAARNAQRQVEEQLRQELPEAIAGVEIEAAIAAERELSLIERRASLDRRAAGLAAKRSEYSQLVASVESRKQVVETGRRQLADANALRAGAGSGSVLARIDGVERGARPVGPGRTTVAASGGLAGLILGVGVVFFGISVPATTSPVSPSGQHHESPRPNSTPAEAAATAPHSGRFGEDWIAATPEPTPYDDSVQYSEASTGLRTVSI
ncbi:hypothetical protein Mal64_00780 [Pseudobythopirellula maris]|uniref:Chain length determinant protein n=1 Tax=Pseudobythopirellula maris TaxID=2527991 RepID=A0A5C5ZQH4_9BACT|nr:hypothetical protein [Pseudobythopirellula maris]TWT89699.1 hypothetical protein Mal64_00780 [Pseudobythopirellula maris]